MSGIKIPEHPELLSQEELDTFIQELLEFLRPVVDAIAKAVDLIVEAFKAILPGILPILSEGYAAAAAEHPKWYHLSRHARRYRTRKKWHNALWKEALR